MATEVGSIYYDLDLDDKKFKAGLSSASAEAKSFSTGLENFFSASVAGSQAFGMGLLALGTTLGVVGGFGLKAAGDLEAMTMGFKTLLGSATKADEAVKMIAKDAASTPFELKGLTQANLLLTSITKDAGKSEEFLLNVGKALSAMGKGQPELDRIIVNLQQIGAVGKASMMDIKQFAFAGIPIFEMLQKQTGLTGDALSSFISDGKVTFSLLEKMFKEAGTGAGRFANAFIDQAGTFNQLLSNVQDTMFIFGGEIVKETGIFDGFKKAMGGALGWISDNKDRIIGGITGIMKALQDNMPIVVGIILGGLAPALGALALAIGGIAIHLAPFMAAGVILAVVLNKIAQRMGGWDKLIDAVWKKIEPFANLVQGTLVPALEKSWDWVGKQIDVFLTWYDNIGGLTGIIKELKNKINEFVNTLKSNHGFMLVFNTTMGVLRDIFNGIWSVGSSLVAFVTTSLIPALQSTWTQIQAAGIVTTILNIVEGAVAGLVLAFKLIWPAVVELANVIITQLWPALMNLWNAIAPVLMPVLNVLLTVLGVIAAVIGAVLVAALWVVINVITWFVKAFSDVIQIISLVVGVIAGVAGTILNFLTLPFRLAIQVIKDIFSGKSIGDIFNGVIDTIGSVLRGASDAIIGPFKRAFEWLDGKLSKAKEAFDKLNPFHRESPSLVDWIQRGTGQMLRDYGSFFDQIDSMASNARPTLRTAVQGVSTAPDVTKGATAAPQVNVQVDMSGIMASSRSDVRVIAKDLIESVNEELRAKGQPELGAL